MNLSLELMIEIVLAVLAFALIINVAFDMLYQNKECAGIMPLNDGNSLIGPSTYSSGYTPVSWSYDLEANESSPCKWKCREGYIRNNNSCVVK